MTRALRLAALALLAAMTLVARAEARCTVETFATLHVTVTDLRPITSAKINGVDTVFLTDSGAFFSQITPAKAAEFNLKTELAPFGLEVYGVGGSEKVFLTKVKRFTIVDQTVNNIEFLVGGSEIGGDTAGLIGQNILGLADADYDLANGVIKLVRPISCGDKPLVYWTTNPFSVLDLINDGSRHPLTQSVVHVNGVRMRAVFDTGAAQSVLSIEAAKRAGIDINGTGVTPAGLSGGIGRHRGQTWIAPVNSFKVGDEEVMHTHLRIGLSGLENVDMLLGADFFLSHHVYVSNSQQKVYFTYNGGHVFDLSLDPPGQADAKPLPMPDGRQVAKPTATTEAEPTDAEGFAGRGVAYASRRNFTHAIADLTKAVGLAPTEPRYLFERAEVYQQNSQPFLAMADLEQGLKLAPGNIQGLVDRARFEFAGHDKPHAIADLDTVDRLAAKQADVRLVLAELYETAREYPPALAQYDLWIAAHPEDSRRAEALSNRCWVRAVGPRDLDKALADCNAAVRLEPKLGAALGDRGLVELLRGDLDKAIADYDADLAIRPKAAWALYGRGLAKLKKGLTADGNADIAAAVALRPGIPAEAKTYGLTPPGA